MSVIKLIRHSFHTLDRVLPAVLFAVLLSVQGLVAAGAADNLISAELIGPDGSTLTYADFCSSLGGGSNAGSHCGGCSLSGGALLPAVVVETLTKPYASSAQLPYLRHVVAKTPERWQHHRRGPPIA